MPGKAKEDRTKVWDCKMCCDQMMGGPRCFEHNPTPEEREAHPGLYPRGKFMRSIRSKRR